MGITFEMYIPTFVCDRYAIFVNKRHRICLCAIFTICADVLAVQNTE